uniref:Uncharacterized protein n=1 Tax=Cucumis melo TaxID=3656 RepID=A0A9I9D5E7_CUCME
MPQEWALYRQVSDVATFSIVDVHVNVGNNVRLTHSPNIGFGFTPMFQDGRRNLRRHKHIADVIWFCIGFAYSDTVLPTPSPTCLYASG